MKDDPIVIVSSARTPMGGFQGDLQGMTAWQLGAAAIRAAVERSGLPAENVQDVLTCMSYLQSLDNPANKKFVAAFKAKYGDKRVTGDTLASAYTAVYLWKMAVEKAKSFDVDKVVAASANLEFEGPEGKVKFHATNHHLWKQARIGSFTADGQVKLIYESPLIEPNPYPTL